MQVWVCVAFAHNMGRMVSEGKACGAGDPHHRVALLPFEKHAIDAIVRTSFFPE